jgi:hypothetical protein
MLEDFVHLEIFFFCLFHHNGRRGSGHRRTVRESGGAIVKLLEMRDVHYRVCFVSLG